MSCKIQTLEEWNKEGVERFGANYEDWKFKCPACGHVASGKEFKALGAKPNDMFQNCIGRINGEGSGSAKDYGKGCNWAAYGLFGTLGNGRIVVKPDGEKIEVFDYAKEEE